MSNLKSYAYPGFGEFAIKNFSYTQAIRVGDRIICSGQGGWSPANTEIDVASLIKEDLLEEIDQAFSNVDHNLKHAGGKGWEQVYKVVTYSTDIRPQHARIVEKLKKWMPNHNAVWTEVGVKQLGLDTMRFEIEVEAFDEEGAKEVRNQKAKEA